MYVSRFIDSIPNVLLKAYDPDSTMHRALYGRSHACYFKNHVLHIVSKKRKHVHKLTMQSILQNKLWLSKATLDLSALSWI